MCVAAGIQMMSLPGKKQVDHLVDHDSQPVHYIKSYWLLVSIIAQRLDAQSISLFFAEVH